MSNNDLKAGLLTFPSPLWDNGLDFSQFSKSQVILILSDILQKYGKFPVQWSASELHEGLFVKGSDNRYIGSWTTIEHIDKNDDSADASMACEDLGDAELAAKVIFKTHFSNLPLLGSDDEVDSG